MPYCKECGHELRRGAKFCSNCGIRISEPPTKPIKKPLEKPKKREIPAGRKALHWAISAAILYSVAGGFYLGGHTQTWLLSVGTFFLILALVFTVTAAQIHYRG